MRGVDHARERRLRGERVGRQDIERSRAEPVRRGGAAVVHEEIGARIERAADRGPASRCACRASRRPGGGRRSRSPRPGRSRRRAPAGRPTPWRRADCRIGSRSSRSPRGEPWKATSRVAASQRRKSSRRSGSSGERPAISSAASGSKRASVAASSSTGPSRGSLASRRYSVRRPPRIAPPARTGSPRSRAIDRRAASAAGGAASATRGRARG